MTAPPRPPWSSSWEDTLHPDLSRARGTRARVTEVRRPRARTPDPARAALVASTAALAAEVHGARDREAAARDHVALVAAPRVVAEWRRLRTEHAAALTAARIWRSVHPRGLPDHLLDRLSELTAALAANAADRARIRASLVTDPRLANPPRALTASASRVLARLGAEVHPPLTTAQRRTLLAWIAPGRRGTSATADRRTWPGHGRST